MFKKSLQSDLSNALISRKIFHLRTLFFNVNSGIVGNIDGKFAINWTDNSKQNCQSLCHLVYDDLDKCDEDTDNL